VAIPLGLHSELKCSHVHCSGGQETPTTCVDCGAG
jgi:hypothetical protein